MPLQAYDLIESICSAVPTELASRSSMYVPLDLLSMSIKAKDKGKDTDSEPGVIRKSRIEQKVYLSAAMLTNIIGQIAQRFRVVSASESIMHYKMHGHNESKYVGRAKMSVHANARNVSQGLFAHDLASSLKLSEPGSVSGSGSVSPIRRENSDWKMKRSVSQAISDESCKDDVGLIIRSATEASACLLQLLKITDQLLFSSSRRTMDEVRDTVTFGKFTVQEWMTAAPPGYPLAAVTNSVTSF